MQAAAAAAAWDLMISVPGLTEETTMFDRNILIGFAAGLLAGVVGYKLYSDNKSSIDARLKSIGAGCACPGSEQDECCDCSSAELSLEELEAQKERLEDLIAEHKAQVEQAAKGAQAAEAK